MMVPFIKYKLPREYKETYVKIPALYDGAIYFSKILIFFLDKRKVRSRQKHVGIDPIFR